MKSLLFGKLDKGHNYVKNALLVFVKRATIKGYITGFVITMGAFCSNVVLSQNYLQKFDEKITPSPMVANLGSFGGVNVTKNTGGITKSIPLFEVTQNKLSYSPSVDYGSVGIRIDDWGTRVGIGWRENSSAFITRVVKGTPDERATGRTPDDKYLFENVSSNSITPSQFNSVKALSASNTTFDGEFDIFEYNLFGKTGQFIIKNNQAFLLKEDDNLKISILSPTTYGFVITASNGTKYYFNSETESTKYSSENTCQIENPNPWGYVTTGWFLEKMVSPTGGAISFEYNSIQYSYIYDYTEFYSYTSYNNKFLPCTNDGIPGTPDQKDEGRVNSNTACLRSKDVNTKVLSIVSGENFVVIYDYSSRNDIYGENLLTNITISNRTSITKTIQLEYDEVVTSSIIEPVILNELNALDQAELRSLRTRYFLNKLIISGSEGEEMSYGFSYLKPSDLPHRFSFSKDHLGCYNGKNNSGLVSQGALSGIENLGISIPLADRTPSIVGSSGLLQTITYPTGGSDIIAYEQNLYPAVDTLLDWDWYSDNLVVNNINQQIDQDFFVMTVPEDIKLNAVLSLRCYYDSDDPLPHHDAEYYADVDLIKIQDGVTTVIALPGNNTTLTLFPHRNQSWGLYSGELSFPKDKSTFYMLRVTLVGNHTALEAKFDYVYDSTHIHVNKPFVGYRVKDVITYSNTGSNLVKTYNYNSFSINNRELVIDPNLSSITVQHPKNFRASGVNVCYDYFHSFNWPGAILNSVFYYETYRLMPEDNFNINVYGGLPYAYACVTEFYDSTSKNMFTAIKYNISSNGYAGWITDLPDNINVSPVYPTLENYAWDHGLETNRYVGTKANGNYLLLNENRYSYSATENTYYNYSASKIKQDLYSSDNFSNYLVTYYYYYSNWVKLDMMTETNYGIPGSTGAPLVNKTVYKYNNDDKMPEEVRQYNSKGDELIKQTFRPYKMVSSGLDPTGIYQNMINANIILPEIEVKNNIKHSSSSGETQLSLERVQYSSPSPGVYLPESILTQQASTTPLETRAIITKYDGRGNILEQQKANDTKTVYLWGYKGQYVVAKIIGTDFNTVQSKIDTALLNNGSEIQVRAALNSLRTAFSSNSPIQIYTYTYKPLIGVSSQTEPNGKITYYDYDTFNRLKIIMDDKGNILKSFEYKYQQ